MRIAVQADAEWIAVSEVAPVGIQNAFNLEALTDLNKVRHVVHGVGQIGTVALPAARTGTDHGGQPHLGKLA